MSKHEKEDDKNNTTETDTTLTGRRRVRIPAESTGSRTRTIKTIRTRRSDHYGAVLVG